MPKKTVGVRGRDGTSTKDISIPAGIAREHDIEIGDEFAIDTARDENGRLVVRYTRLDEANGNSE
ncbi:AbrB/MazE/SpoVT family DNA-binding domain-containing protein [Halosimplex sp. TS25]|uniref:AbrB/MazE/SpoVT family DNA-binding domain-containing protein n=1 Tax=Halosimplex rarum TaxID=3396619 RepID=UPI0039EB5367